MQKKIISALVVLAVFFGLPLAARPQLLMHPCIILMMAATTLVWLTQPAITKEDAEKNRISDRNSVWTILLLSAVSVIAPVVEWAYFDVQHLNFGIWQVAGSVVIAGGVALRIWAIRILGAFFTATVQVQQDQRVIITGPYAWIRHPSYMGAYLAFMGCAVLLQAWLGLAVAMVCMGVAYFVRINAEEKALVRAFGEEYRSYQRHTWRMAPWIW